MRSFLPAGDRVMSRILGWRAFALCALGLVLVACGDAPSTLAPRGPRAAEISRLWWAMFGLGTFIWLLVTFLLFYALLVRRPDGGLHSTPLRARWWILLGGIVLPVVILLVVYGHTLYTLSVLAAPATPPEVRIQVTGYQFWWEVHYPEQEIRSANEIHIPVGEPVEIMLTAEDVIHNFWVPQLMGKMDMIPGKSNTIWIEATEPGIYWGECAEYCGIQHAKMAFVVVAEPREQFEAWLERERQPAAEPADPLAQRGKEVFLNYTCAYCHAIRGTPANGQLGPDLTHIGSRLTVGAGSVKNNRGNLGGWIVDPHSIKPGNHMPPSTIGSEELLALLAYLEGLE